MQVRVGCGVNVSSEVFLGGLSSIFVQLRGRPDSSMHELLKHVLTERDLTRAGDIFAIADTDIVDDLNEVVSYETCLSANQRQMSINYLQILTRFFLLFFTFSFKLKYKQEMSIILTFSSMFSSVYSNFFTNKYVNYE